jgi:hypothetical protein
VPDEQLLPEQGVPRDAHNGAEDVSEYPDDRGDDPERLGDG